ncbi:MAG TPA: AraC family transcriptional regulator, partial [Bacteroidales bacterium]
MSQPVVEHKPIAFYEYPLSVDMLRIPNVKEESISQELPYGSIHMKHWCFDGIRIGFTSHRFNDHFYFEKTNDPDVVNLEFNLKGNYTIHQQGQVYDVRSQQHNIVYSPGHHNTFRNGDLHTETFVVQFTPEIFLRIIEDSNRVLKRFAERMMDGKPAVLAQESLFINPELQRTIHDVLNCRFTGGLKKMFLLSKSIEILVLQAEAYDRAFRNKDLYCKRKDDQERIMFARDYLIQHVDMPPNLSELSKKAGINEYKLKRGFKEMFNATVFGYLSDYRLDRAREALLDDRKTISEI